MAWSVAAEQDPDYYLLANDDTLLDDHAVSALLNITGSPDSRVIAVAAVRDPQSGHRTSGGIHGKNNAAALTGSVEECDTFNANATLIPRKVYAELGIFHPAYSHGMGDFDYGYLATRRGIRIFQSAQMLGTCPRNSNAGTWLDLSLSRLERIRKLQSPKGLPWKEWVVYNRRNAGWIWPWRCVSPFLRILCGR